MFVGVILVSITIIVVSRLVKTCAKDDDENDVGKTFYLYVTLLLLFFNDFIKRRNHNTKW